MDTEYKFIQHVVAAEGLLERASRDQLIEALKMLSLYFGYVSQRFGDIPDDELLQMTTAAPFSEETQAMVMAGMRKLVGLMTNVLNRGIADETRH